MALSKTLTAVRYAANSHQSAMADVQQLADRLTIGCRSLDAVSDRVESSALDVFHTVASVREAARTHEESMARLADAAARFRDTMHLHQQALPRDQLLARRAWVAIRLSDGGSDNTTYESRTEAIKHQIFSTQCGYLPVPLERIDLYTADSLLWYWEKMYDAGHRPKEDNILILPNTFDGMIEDILREGGTL